MHVSRRFAPALIGLSAPKIVRAFTMDNAFGIGHNGGPAIGSPMTYDQATIDAAGAFLIGELERLDQTLHMPLVAVSWQRDIDLREDVTIGDELSSFTNSSFAAAGGMTPAGKAWTSSNANTIPGVALDIGKTSRPLHQWAMEIKWDLFELESARRLGRPVDAQKLEGLKLKHSMDIDEQVYIGDTLKGAKGLLNHSAVTPSNVPNGAAASPLWVNKTPDEILKDFNTGINLAWAATGWTVAPEEVRIPTDSYSYLSGTRVSANSDTTILEFIREKNLSSTINGKPINIQPLKWANSAGASGVRRMLIYTRKEQFVRFPMVPLQRTPLEYRQLHQITTYYCRLGEVEMPYPETVAYLDGM